jgi:6-methylsalicylic acid synthase
MGVPLLAESPFEAAIDAMEPIFEAELGFSPRLTLTSGDIEGVDRIQTMIFAMQVGLAALLRARGAAPAAVIGHSVGEIAAAVVAGALSLHDGAVLICRRSRLLRRVAGNGAMVMVMLPFEDVERQLGGRTDAVAAIASAPAATVAAGTPESIAELAESWRAAGVGIRQVASDVAFHSPHMDPLLDDLKAAAAGLRPRPYTVPVYSTVLPDPRTTPTADGTYWAANLRNPVRLAAAVTAAAEDGHRAFLEISPHPVVAHSVSQTLTGLGIDDAFVSGTLRRKRPQLETLEAALAALSGHAADPVPVPTNA